MAYPSIYEQKTVEALAQRIGKLSKHSSANWGKMNVAQMLAHLNVTYDLAYDKIQSPTNFFTKILL